MALLSYNNISGKKIPRIEALSDGVFAIALTILVLDLRVPVAASIQSETELFKAFLGLTPKLLSYFLSFMTLGIFWTAQTTHFNYIDKSDRHLNWISLFFLLVVSLLPFTTAFLSEYIKFKFSIGLYWLNLLLLGCMLYLHWQYACKHNLVNIDGAERKEVDKTIRNRIIIYQALYALCALACFINTYISVCAFIALQLNSGFAIFSKRVRNLPLKQ